MEIKAQQNAKHRWIKISFGFGMQKYIFEMAYYTCPLSGRRYSST